MDLGGRIERIGTRVYPLSINSETRLAEPTCLHECIQFFGQFVRYFNHSSQELSLGVHSPVINPRTLLLKSLSHG